MFEPGYPDHHRLHTLISHLPPSKAGKTFVPHSLYKSKNSPILHVLVDSHFRTRAQNDTIVSEKPSKLYHCTTPRKVKYYKATGHIISPVRGFTTLQAAMAWCIKTGRTVILEINGWEEIEIHKLPDHHNKFGIAYWVDKHITEWNCVFSSESDA